MALSEVIMQTVIHVSDELEKAQAELVKGGKAIAKTADLLFDLEVPQSSHEMARNMELLPGSAADEPEVSRVQVKVTIGVTTKTPKAKPHTRILVRGQSV